MERINILWENYYKGRIARLRSRGNNCRLSMGEVIKKIPDITLNELMDNARLVLDPNGSSDSSTDAFKSLQRMTVQHWIDNTFKVAPDVAERLDKELNPEDSI